MLFNKIVNITRIFKKFKFEMIRQGHLLWYKRVIRLLATQKKMVEFTCNICGTSNKGLGRDVFDREKSSCTGCGANLRARAIVDILSRHLHGESLILAEFPEDSSIKGLGMSDWLGYARPLEQKMSYQNTYYHKDPQFDITNVDPNEFGKYDFVISSDVVEHINPPVEVGFKNLQRLLKPNGILIITVPFMNFESTWEHFPGLFDYKITKTNGKFVLRNKTREGRIQLFDDLVFHGGPGSTLEMRIFTRSSLENNLLSGDFSKINFHRDENLKYGIRWLVNWSFPVSAIHD